MAATTKTKVNEPVETSLDVIENSYFTKKEILLAITETAGKVGAFDENDPNVQRLRALEDVAWRKRGVTQFEIEQAILRGLPEKDRAEYLRKIIENGIYIRESIAELKQEFAPEN